MKTNSHVLIILTILFGLCAKVEARFTTTEQEGSFFKEEEIFILSVLQSLYPEEH